MFFLYVVSQTLVNHYLCKSVVFYLIAIKTELMCIKIVLINRRYGGKRERNSGRPGSLF